MLHGLISSYSAIELVNVKDRTTAVTDRLLMNQAASSFDVTAYEVPKTRDRIRLASAGAKALPTCFTGSVEVLQHLVMVIALSIILLYYHPLIAALVFLPAIPLFYTQLKVRSHTFAALVYKSPLYRQMGYLLELMLGEIAKTAPQGYETQLGKEFLNGTDLSGGQWQKVALARGFVRDASVIFLDEPTASLDPKTEKTLFEQLLSLAEGKTAIVISHRLFITPLVDRIFVLDQGRLIEQGTHDELMGRDGVYAGIYKTQAGMYWPRDSITS